MKCSGLKVTHAAGYLVCHFLSLKAAPRRTERLLSRRFPSFSQRAWLACPRFRGSLVHLDVCRTTPCLSVSWCPPAAKFSGSALKSRYFTFIFFMIITDMTSFRVFTLNVTPTAPAFAPGHPQLPVTQFLKLVNKALPK